MDFPKVYKVRQRFTTNKLENISEEIEVQLEKMNFRSYITKDQLIKVNSYF